MKLNYQKDKKTGCSMWSTAMVICFLMLAANCIYHFIRYGCLCQFGNLLNGALVFSCYEYMASKIDSLMSDGEEEDENDDYDDDDYDDFDM